MSSTSAIFLFAMSSLASGAAFADTAPTQPVQTTSTEHIQFAPGGTIQLNDSSGYLSVEGWDRPEIEITIVKSMGYDNEPASKATHQMDSVKVATERLSEIEIAISTTRVRTHNRFARSVRIGRGAVVEYRIRVPRNSHLVVRHDGGNVLVTGLTGNVEATNRRGDIILMLADLSAYSIDAHTKAGVVTSDLAGNIRRHRLLGEDFTHAGTAVSSHRLSLHMGFGGITIKELPAESLSPTIETAR